MVLLNANSPQKEPEKSYNKPSIEKAEKQVELKPDTKPKVENKIERPKIDVSKEPKNKIKRDKIDLDTPAKNKIQRPKIDLDKEPRSKIQREKIDLDSQAKNKIERPKIDLNQEPKNKIQSHKSTSGITKSKIERVPTEMLQRTIRAGDILPSLEQIKKEMKKIDWKSISENWTINIGVNKEITLNPYAPPSKENPLYKHKKWLQTVYNHKKWNLNDNKLTKISGVSYTAISNWRKKYDVAKKPFNNGTHKECGRCHQIKSQSEFKYRNDKRKEKPYLRSNCNKCKSELNQIYQFKNKHKILTNMYNCKYKQKCPECETQFNKLPAFDFHHPDKNLKSTQRIRTRGNWKNTMERLEQEKAIPLCKNCHSIKQATFYNKHKKKILKKNDFEKDLDGFEKKFNQKFGSHASYDERRQIKSWIKKRIVTVNLYRGMCIGCGEGNLPTLQFHHRNPKQKTYQKWSNLSKLKIGEIMEKLRRDNAVCLCANCHGMTESLHFKKSMREIVEKAEINELKAFYGRLDRNIKKFSFPNILEE